MATEFHAGITKSMIWAHHELPELKTESVHEKPVARSSQLLLPLLGGEFSAGGRVR